MSKNNVFLINEMQNNLTCFPRADVVRQIAQERGPITAAAKAQAVAKWVKETVERLDGIADQETMDGPGAAVLLL